MTQANRKPKRKAKFRVGQVVVTLGNSSGTGAYGVVMSHYEKTFDGINRYLVVSGHDSGTWMEFNLRPLTKREIGPR